MLKNSLALGELIVIFSLLVSGNHCTRNAQFARQLKLENEDFKMSDLKLVNEPQKNSSLITVNDTRFWTDSPTKKGPEVVPPEMNVLDFQKSQDVKTDTDSLITEENRKEDSNSNKSAIVKPVTATEPAREEIQYKDFPQKLNDSFQISEKIVMARNNCQADIAVHENRSTKLTIKFGPLQNNSYGKCCLTLNGHKNSKLGVIISNVHLYRNNTQGEVLKVIVGNHHSAFVLKEYHGSKDYEPLLLTETHKVYLVLNYEVEYKAPRQECTYFNLEVFTYQKYGNNIHHYDNNHKDSYNHIDSAQVNRVHDVYSSRKGNYFIPYIYDRTY